jgi:hypothetical protein
MTWAEACALPPIVTVPVAARVLGVGVRTLRASLRDGTLAEYGIRTIYRGSQLRVAKADLLHPGGV